MSKVQQLLFDKIKPLIPPQNSLVEVISEILSISNDGVYRRLRAETPLRLDEAAKLCSHFRLSLDEINEEAAGEKIIFQPGGALANNLDFEAYLRSLLQLSREMQGLGIDQGVYVARDTPIFHYLEFPELVAFKWYFWQKSIFPNPHVANRPFSFADFETELDTCLSLGRQIADTYSLVPTTEIWTDETPYSFFKQIVYYYESGHFKTKADALLILDKLEEMYGHVRDQARIGYKYIKDHPPNNRLDNYYLYFNDLVLMNDMILVYFGDSILVYLIYNSNQYLSTTHPRFCGQVSEWVETLKGKSQLISKTGERQRNRFFRRIQDRIQETRALLNR